MGSSNHSDLPRRSVLFLSALQADQVGRALASGADVLCLDLEDGVPVTHKAEGRQLMIGAMESAAADHAIQLAVRINSPRTRDGLSDILALCEMNANVQIVIPKIESEAEVTWVTALLEEAGKAPSVHCVIETCDALHRVKSIAASSGSVRSLMFGGFDLSAALGVSMEWDALQYARSRVVHAAATIGIDVLDAPHLTRDDPTGLLASTQLSRRFGFTGRITKDIDQIAAINSVFTPSLNDLEKAAEIVARFEESPYSQIEVDGKIIEQPEIRAIKRLLALAHRRGV